MAELLTLRDLNGKPIGSQEREAFYREVYKEYAETGIITRQPEVVWIIAMTPNGHVYCQERAKTKEFNPKRFDKTVGGHMPFGYSANFVAGSECVEELGIAISIAKKSDFIKAAREEDISHLEVRGIAKKICRLNGYLSTRVMADGGIIELPQVVHVYIAYFHGRILFRDGESCSVKAFDQEDLAELLNDSPEKATSDLRFIAKRFRKHLIPMKDQKI